MRLQRIGKISVKILQGLSNNLIPIRLIKSLCKCGTISVEKLMSVDEIDTILLIEKTIADTLATKANFTAKLHTNGQR